MDRFRTLFLYLTIFVSGAAVLVLEIIGTRIVSPFYGTTVFVWTSLIVVTLGALSLGYWLGGILIDKRPLASTLYSLTFCVGVLMLIPMKIDQWVLPLTNPLGLQYGPLVAAFILFFAPLLLAGMISPSAIRLVTSYAEESGSKSGTVFALSTLGSIVGGFLAGFYFLDKLSLTQTLNYTGIALVLISLVGFSHSSKKKVNLITLFALSLTVFLLPKYIYKDTYTLQIHQHEQSFYADLKVMEIGNFICLAMNGSLQSCFNKQAERPTFTYIPETERIIGIREPKTMLLLGMGTGNVLHDLPSALDVDVVELDPAIFPISEDYFDLTPDKYTNLIFDDGRHFLINNPKKYDLILVDTFLGSSLPTHLFTVEAMELWNSSLADGGLILANFEGKLGSSDTQLKTVMKTAEAVFDTVKLTTTEPDRFTSVLLHLSQDSDYMFEPGGVFQEVAVDLTTEEVMTDDFNKLEIISIPKLSIFRDEMINVGGLRLLFGI